MVTRIVGGVWSLLTLPIKLVLLPFKIVSMLVSLVIYALILLVLSGAVYFLVL